MAIARRCNRIHVTIIPEMQIITGRDEYFVVEAETISLNAQRKGRSNSQTPMLSSIPSFALQQIACSQTFPSPQFVYRKAAFSIHPSPSLASACLSQYCVAIFAIVPDRAQIGMFKEFFCKLSLPFAWQEISPPGPHHLYLARAQRACLQVLFPGFASDVREFHALASLAVGLGADL